MRKLVDIGCAAAIILGAAVMGAGPSAAGGVPPLQVDGPLGPGGTVTVSGMECLFTNQMDQELPGSAFVGFRRIDPFEPIDGQNPSVGFDGNWSATFTIPTDAEPGAQYEFIASCSGFVPDPVTFQYPTFVFTMGQPVTTTTAAPTSTVPVNPTSTTPGSTSTTAARPATVTPRVTG